jgi:hypothetical protein
MAIIQIQTDPNTSRLMMAHLRNLMEDAVFHGWEPVKQAHSIILSALESGAFTWADELQMAEKRRSAIARASQACARDSLVSPANSKPFSQGRQAGRVGGNTGFRQNSAVQRKIVKTCLYFNNNVCVKKSDHEEGNIFYRHICSQCFANDHNVKDCPLLMNTT